MYKNDYIMRMIEQMSEAIASIIFNKKIKNYQTCHFIFDDSLKQFFGVSREMLFMLPIDTTLDLICGYGESHTDMIVSIVELLIIEANTYEDEEKFTDAKTYYKKTLEFVNKLKGTDDLEMIKYINEQEIYLKSKIIE
ncbi:MAG: DUF6483 family protein [Eubacteriaceae bacterium]